LTIIYQTLWSAKAVSEYNTISTTLEQVLNRYRDPLGNVDYFSMMGDAGTASFAESLVSFNLETLDTKEKRLAFWINCYNSLSIYGVIKKLRADPSFAQKGNSSWFQRVRFFALQKFKVGGAEITLREIENNLRSDYNEPRIHFALNCSSMGCPVLKDGRYSEEHIYEELEAAAILYIRSPQGAVLDADAHTMHLSLIFKWYKKDFEATGKTVPEYVAAFLPPEEKEFVMRDQGSIRIKYLDYDWSLNASAEGSGSE
jgi:hypothetical protein